MAKLLQVGGKPDAEKLLLRFAGQFLIEHKLQKIPSKLPATFSVVSDVLSSFTDCFSAVICLLSPVPHYLGAEIRHVESLLQLRSDDFLESELQEAMREEGFWKDRLELARKHASAEAECAKKIGEHVTAMMDAKNPVQQLSAAKDALASAVSMKPQLRPGARPLCGFYRLYSYTYTA